MRITICELNDSEEAFAADWEALKLHLKEQPTDLLLLPEMPFCEWIADTRDPDDQIKEYAVKRHEELAAEFNQLNAKHIVYSKPVIKEGLFLNSAFVRSHNGKDRFIHSKQYLPEEAHFYESSWFDADDQGFGILDLGEIRIAVLLCTEVWFTEHARRYGEAGADLLLCPRATGKSSVEQWVRCGQTLAVLSGAFCLSANRRGNGKNGFEWGGTGWIAQPEDGKLLGTTGAEQQFLTVEIDLAKSKKAKKEYPLYVKN